MLCIDIVSCMLQPHWEPVAGCALGDGEQTSGQVQLAALQDMHVRSHWLTALSAPSAQWERHSRQSSGSEAGNGVQEPPPTPASASHTPSLASSYNSGAAAASARATYPTLKGAGEKLARGARAKKAASSPGRGGADSEGEDVFQDAAEALPGLPGGAPSTAGVVGRVI